MKKILIFALVVCMVMPFVACKDTSNISNSTNNSEDSYVSNGTTDDNSSNIDPDSNVDNLICSTHNYIDNTCSVCNCSLWSGEVDTSWYSVIDLECKISTAEQFAGLIELVNSGSNFENVKVTLSNHIDMNNKPISPIGATSENEFSGEFNGDDYSISNVVIDTNSLILSGGETFDGKLYYSAYVGLFGYSNGAISNLDLKNLSIDISSAIINYVSIGGLVAYCNANIDNCSVQGKITVNTHDQFLVGGIVASARGNVTKCSSDISIAAHLSCENFDISPYIAGLVADSTDNIVSECFSKGSISFIMSQDEVEMNELYMGGLIGESSKVDIANCYSTVDVTASAIRNNVCQVGGLLGKMAKGSVKSCYATGNVSLNCRENGYAGALIGYIRADYFSSVMSKISVSDCFTIGNVFCKTEDLDGVAASIGQNADEVVTNCYYLSEQVLTGDWIAKDGSPASQTDLKNIMFYTNRMPWDTEVWDLIDGNYPTLK